MNFEEVYSTYKKQIHGFVLYWVKNSENAKDVTQEIFIKAERAYKGLKDEKAIRAWLYSIARNCCLDYLRVNKMRQEVEISNDLSSHLDIALKIEQKDMSRCVQNYINSLEEPARSILILKDIEGFRFREISTIVNMSVDATKMSASRTRKKLKEILSNNCTFFHDERNVLRCEKK